MFGVDGKVGESFPATPPKAVGDLHQSGLMRQIGAHVLQVRADVRRETAGRRSFVDVASRVGERPDGSR